MRRRYRLVVLAAFVWLSLGPGIQSGAAHGQEKDQQQTKKSAPGQTSPRTQGFHIGEGRCYPEADPKLSCNGIATKAAVDQAINAAKQTALLRQQLRVGLGTLVAAVLAALFAWRASSIAKATAQRQLRAYVGLERIHIYELPTGNIQIQPIWKNYGQTPTRHGKQNSSHFFGDREPNDTFTFPENPNPPWPHDLYPGRESLTQGSNISSVEVEWVRSNARYCMIYGWFEYADIFPNTKRHRTEFCVRLQVDGSKFRFMSMDRFNGADATAQPCITESSKNYSGLWTS